MSFGMKTIFVKTGLGSCATTSRSLLGQEVRTLTALCTISRLSGKSSARPLEQFWGHPQAKIAMIPRRNRRNLMPQLKDNQTQLILRTHLARALM